MQRRMALHAKDFVSLASRKLTSRSHSVGNQIKTSMQSEEFSLKSQIVNFFVFWATTELENLLCFLCLLELLSQLKVVPRYADSILLNKSMR